MMSGLSNYDLCGIKLLSKGRAWKNVVPYLFWKVDPNSKTIMKDKQFTKLDVVGGPGVPELNVTEYSLDGTTKVHNVFEALQKQGVIVRPMDGYQLPEWIRITVGAPQENERCLAALKTAIRAIQSIP